MLSATGYTNVKGKLKLTCISSNYLCGTKRKHVVLCIMITDSHPCLWVRRCTCGWSTPPWCLRAQSWMGLQREKTTRLLNLKNSLAFFRSVKSGLTLTEICTLSSTAFTNKEDSGNVVAIGGHVLVRCLFLWHAKSMAAKTDPEHIKDQNVHGVYSSEVMMKRMLPCTNHQVDHDEILLGHFLEVPPGNKGLLQRCEHNVVFRPDWS